MKIWSLLGLIIVAAAFVRPVEAGTANNTGKSNSEPVKLCGAQPQFDKNDLSPESTQSLDALIRVGENIRTKRLYDACKLKKIVKLDRELSKPNDILSAKVQRLNKEIDTLNARQSHLQNRTAAFRRRCTSQDFDMDYNSPDCAVESGNIKASIRALRLSNNRLKKKISEIKSGGKKLSEEFNILKKQYGLTYRAWKQDIYNEVAWMYTVRMLIGNSGFAMVQKKYGCPDLSKTPTSAAQLNKSINITIDCLKKVPKLQ